MPYCHNCKKHFHKLGILRHRAMHRDRKEKVKITFTNGETYVYDYNNHDK